MMITRNNRETPEENKNHNKDNFEYFSDEYKISNKSNFFLI